MSAWTFQRIGQFATGAALFGVLAAAAYTSEQLFVMLIGIPGTLFWLPVCFLGGSKLFDFAHRMISSGRE